MIDPDLKTGSQTDDEDELNENQPSPPGAVENTNNRESGKKDEGDESLTLPGARDNEDEVKVQDS